MVKNIKIVSLSSGVIGEKFVRHELDIGLERLNKMGLNVSFSTHAEMGIDYLKNHPEARAADMLEAFADRETDMILCAIGGDDTYRLLPYLFENNELENVISDKIFLGFSDTTVNHFMLNKLGLKTFYGQAFLPDVCELSSEMLPYTLKYFNELVRTGTVKRVTPSDVWYSERISFDMSQLGVSTAEHKNHGFELISGSPTFEGSILGGCIDTIYDMLIDGRYPDSAELCEKYGIFPSEEEWSNKILLLESSEEKMLPEKYRRTLTELKNRGVFNAVSGVLIGKPQQEAYFDEYKRALVEVIDNPSLSILCNINVGHAMPRAIIPFGIHAKVDAVKQEITFG